MSVSDAIDLGSTARSIFADALKSVDAHEAVRRAVRLSGTGLTVLETNYSFKTSTGSVYAIAIGKAATPMAAALDEILGDRFEEGVIAGSPLPQQEPASICVSERWRLFEGGHPLPNQESFAAARASFELLGRASDRRALVVFLISGGGSAMIEWPCDDQVTLEDLRETNRVLVSCGATIGEVNAVRRAISAVKGGGLACRAPRADQISLIISDTNAGEEANVASGPTIAAPHDAGQALSVVNLYDLSERLPGSVLRAISNPQPRRQQLAEDTIRRHYVLLDNEYAIERAAEAARARGFTVEVAGDFVEQNVVEGSSGLLSRLYDLRRRVPAGRVACIISGGEFACPVRGPGIGGRNAETALRWAIAMDALAPSIGNNSGSVRAVALSAGTDGIDGNSPAAGAIADELTLTRARARQLDAQRFLEASDAYTFFKALSDLIVTGATRTNVRDLRVLLAVARA